MTRMALPANGLLVDGAHNGATDAFEGEMRCRCGHAFFRIRHNGRLVSPWIRWWAGDWFLPDGGALVIDACCARCGRTTVLHCSQKDRNGWMLPEAPVMQEFVHPRLRDQRVRLYVGYFWDDEREAEAGQYLTTYTLFSLAARNDEHPAGLHVYEKTC